jgi:hypothetical protein
MSRQDFENSFSYSAQLWLYFYIPFLTKGTDPLLETLYYNDLLFSFHGRDDGMKSTKTGNVRVT